MTLHIIRRHDDAYALRIAALHRDASEGEEIAVLLLQDAVTLNLEQNMPVYVCAEDLDASEASTQRQRIDYDHIAELIETADRVICW